MFVCLVQEKRKMSEYMRVIKGTLAANQLSSSLQADKVLIPGVMFTGICTVGDGRQIHSERGGMLSCQAHPGIKLFSAVLSEMTAPTIIPDFMFPTLNEFGAHASHASSR